MLAQKRLKDSQDRPPENTPNFNEVNRYAYLYGWRGGLKNLHTEIIGFFASVQP